MGDLAGQIYLWEGFIRRCRTSEEESLGKNILRGLMVKILATNHERENGMAKWLERWGGQKAETKQKFGSNCLIGQGSWNRPGKKQHRAEPAQNYNQTGK